MGTSFADIRRRVIAFGAVGAVGFAVDAGVLQTLFAFGTRPLIARAVSFPLAVTATWLLNKRYTFGDRPQTDTQSRYLLYLGGQIAGALINLCAFVLTMHEWPTLAQRPVIPLMVGSALALVFNYSWANALVFRRTPVAPATVSGRQ